MAARPARTWPRSADSARRPNQRLASGRLRTRPRGAQTAEAEDSLRSPGPRIHVRPEKDSTYVVDLLGVDTYDPLTGETHHAPGTDVAAWFLDSDYDGMTFHVPQAFFPGDEDAWEKLQRALRATIDEDAFERMRGAQSFPFTSGKQKRVAVKVIDFRGNEVVRVMSLEPASRGKAS